MKTAVSYAAADAAIAQPVGNMSDDTYREFLQRFKANAHNIIEKKPVFMTDVDPDALWQAYLSAFPLKERQHHNCHACRSFIKHYGNLVYVADSEKLEPVFWYHLEPSHPYAKPFNAMRKLLMKANVNIVQPFYSNLSSWGTAETYPWRHFAVAPNVRAHHDAFKLMAEKRENFKIVSRAVQEFSRRTVDRAVTLLQSDALYMSESVIGPALWLQKIMQLDKVNLVWNEVAQAPNGFCHPRSSMIGTLLEDLQSGMTDAQAAERFAQKMHPLQYQRPTAPPKEGTITQAEKLFEGLGLAKSLKRRPAKLSEIEYIWMPGKPLHKARGAGIFEHLRNEPQTVKGKTSVTMTWVKFVSTMLEQAKKIELFAPDHGPYAGFLEAVHKDAPLLFQWNHSASWYLYSGGSHAHRWGVPRETWLDVLAISLQPNMWERGEGQTEHHSNGVMFVLPNAKDQHNDTLCLFPSMIRGELHGVRAVIEAHSNSSMMGTAVGQLANGLLTQRAAWHEVKLRVTSNSGVVQYVTLDRWD